MTARSGMSNLIARWRRMVNDGGTAVWTDAQAQDLLDDHRLDIWQEPLSVQPVEDSGTVRYYQYMSRYGDFEEASSGTAAWRVYDSDGDAIGTATYTADYVRGMLRFSSDQAGSVRYVDGRSYDLHAAAAEAWRERAATTAPYYSFGADGANYRRSDWFSHCMKMAAMHDARARPMQVSLVRGDLVG